MKIILVSIPKSGTNMFRVALFNYLCHLKGDLSAKTYDDLRDCFPNNFKTYNKETPTPPLMQLPSGYSDFIYGHSINAAQCFDGPIIGLYRNPLDYLISAYHYFYAQRHSNHRHPREIVGERLPQFIGSILKLRDLEKSGRALLISYECMIERPSEGLEKAIEHYDLPLQRDLIPLACEHASMKRARDFEDMHGFLHADDRQKVTAERVPGSRFVRDGRIGQWRNYFLEDEVLTIKQRLSDSGVNWEQFQFLPNDEP